MTDVTQPDPREDRLPVWAKGTLDSLRRRLAEQTKRAEQAEAAHGEQHDSGSRLRLTDPYRSVMYGVAAGGLHALDVSQLSPGSVPSHLRGLPTLRVTATYGYLHVTPQAANAVLLSPERGR